MQDANAEIVALRESIERLTAQIDRLIRRLESPAQTAATEQTAQLRELLERPEVDLEDRNTPSDLLDDQDDDDDAARV